jgi:hypothetical protein
LTGATDKSKQYSLSALVLSATHASNVILEGASFAPRRISTGATQKISGFGMHRSGTVPRLRMTSVVSAAHGPRFIVARMG